MTTVDPKASSTSAQNSSTEDFFPVRVRDATARFLIVVDIERLNRERAISKENDEIARRLRS